MSFFLLDISISHVNLIILNDILDNIVINLVLVRCLFITLILILLILVFLQAFVTHPIPLMTGKYVIDF